MAGWNGSGTFTRTHNWADDQANGIKIRADRHDANDTDFVNGINNCITKDGQNTPSADLPMNSQKHTGVGNGSARNHYGAIGQLQDGDITEIGSISGTDTITGSLSPAITAYAQGQRFSFVAAATNTDAVTIDINSVGAANITKRGTTALVAGDIVENAIHIIEYDGTQFQLLNPADVATLDGDNDFTGDNTFIGKTAVKDGGELTISGGEITITGTSHTVDTESDDSSDDLDTINGGSDGEVLVLRIEDSGRNVVVKHNTGNIVTPDGNDITLDTVNEVLTLIYDAAASDWLVQSSPASGTTSGTFTPAVTSSGGTFTPSYSTQQGDYVKVGDYVFFNVTVAVSSVSGTPSGNLGLSGLPFSTQSTRPVGSHVPCVHISGVDPYGEVANSRSFFLSLGAGVTAGTFFVDVLNGSQTAVPSTNFTSAFTFRITGGYIAD